MRLEVSSDDYSTAADTLGSAGDATGRIVAQLGTALAGTGGMSGTDSGGRTFAEAYDEAARAVVGQLADLGVAFGRLGVLVHAAGVNHAGAEAASGRRGGGAGSSVSPVVPMAVVPHVPSAFGGDGGRPDWWDLVAEHVGGLLWPDASIDRLTQAGVAFESAAASVDGVAWQLDAARSTITAQHSPEVAQALAAVNELDGYRVQIASDLRAVGRECTAYAQEVAAAHHEMYEMAKDFFIGVVAGEVISLVLAPLTAGLSELIGNTVLAERLVVAGSRVAAVLGRLATVADRAGVVLQALAGDGSGLVRVGLEKFLQASPKLAKAVSVGSEEAGAQAAARSVSSVAQARMGGGRLEAAITSRARAVEQRSTCGDPVDVATGEVVMTAMDVETLGAVPLVVRRMYRSQTAPYVLPVTDGVFGQGWSSTLDEHVRPGAAGGVELVRWDGSVLVYPREPVEAEQVVPVAGDRWPMTVDGARLRVTDPVAGTASLYERVGQDSPWRIVRQEDGAGNGVDVEWGPEGLVREMRGPTGAVVRPTYETGRVTQLVLGDGSVLAWFGYTAGLLTSTRSGGSCGETVWEYDSAGGVPRLVAWTDSTGVRYEYVYDRESRCTWQGTTGGVMAFSYAYSVDPDLDLPVTVVTDPQGAATRYVCGWDGFVRDVVDPLGAVTRATLDGMGRVVEVIDAEGGVSSTTYDDAGRMVSVTDSVGATSSVEYDEAGHVVATLDATGVPMRYVVDSAGRLEQARDVYGAVTTWERTPIASGEQITMTDPAGVVTRVDVDSAGLPVMVVDGTGGVTRFERDVFGRVVREIDPAGVMTTTQFSVDGLPVEQVRAVGLREESRESWRYDGEGNVVENVDPSGRTTRWEYGPFDVPTARIAADGTRVELEYDRSRRLVAVTNENGQTYRYERDVRGRVVAQVDYDGRVTRFAMDRVGRLVERVNGAGQVTRLGYDLAGALVSETHDLPDGGQRHLSYTVDAVGRLLDAAEDGAARALSRDVDLVGRILSESVDGRTVAWEYDAAGRVTARTLPSGVVSRYGFDAAGLRDRVDLGGHAIRLERDDRGQVTAAVSAGSVIETGYDALGRVRHRGVDADSRWRMSYTFTPSGEVASVDHSSSGRRDVVLDPVGRVLDVMSGDRTVERYRYDPAGNMTTAEWPDAPNDVVGSREFDGSVMVRAGREHVEHDGAGRVVRRVRRTLSGARLEWRFGWDAADRLVWADVPDGSRWHYRYDPLGRRTRKERDGGDDAVVFAWDGTTVVEQTRVGGDVYRTTTWEYERWEPLAQLSFSHRPEDAAAGSQGLPSGLNMGVEPAAAPAVGSVDEWSQDVFDQLFVAIVSDLVGAPRAAVDGDGRLWWESAPSVWGAGGGGPGVPLRFPGQFADDETGLFYNLFRYYDPTTGRYLSPDPLGLEPSPNPYAYPANPTTHVDPLGLSPCEPTLPSRRAAFRQAKRDAGIAVSQTPIVEKVAFRKLFNKNGDRYNGPQLTARTYQFSVGHRGGVSIQDHGRGHYFGEGGIGDQGPHFNVRELNKETGVFNGTDPHYPFNAGRGEALD